MGGGDGEKKNTAGSGQAASRKWARSQRSRVSRGRALAPKESQARTARSRPRLTAACAPLLDRRLAHIVDAEKKEKTMRVYGTLRLHDAMLTACTALLENSYMFSVIP